MSEKKEQAKRKGQVKKITGVQDNLAMRRNKMINKQPPEVFCKNRCT